MRTWHEELATKSFEMRVVWDDGYAQLDSFADMAESVCDDHPLDVPVNVGLLIRENARLRGLVSQLSVLIRDTIVAEKQAK